MTLLEFLKALFISQPVEKPVVQKDIQQKENSSSLDEEEELVAMEVVDEEEEFFIQQPLFFITKNPSIIKD